MNEEKKIIKGYSNYEMFEDGRIFDKRKQKFVKPIKVKVQGRRYFTVYLYNDEGEKKLVYVHKLKRETFGIKFPELEGAEHKVIEGFENYSIYSNGIVYSHLRNIFLKYVFVNDRKYVVLVKDKQTHSLSVAKLVAQAFIPNYSEEGFLIFKDKDYSNCDVNNLEFRSQRHIRRKKQKQN